MDPLSGSPQMPYAPGMESTRRKADHGKSALVTARLRAFTTIRRVKAPSAR
jgi:hypothetical protein